MKTKIKRNNEKITIKNELKCLKVVLIALFLCIIAFLFLTNRNKQKDERLEKYDSALSALRYIDEDIRRPQWNYDYNSKKMEEAEEKLKKLNAERAELLTTIIKLEVIGSEAEEYGPAVESLESIEKYIENRQWSYNYIHKEARELEEESKKSNIGPGFFLETKMQNAKESERLAKEELKRLNTKRVELLATINKLEPIKHEIVKYIFTIKDLGKIDEKISREERGRQLWHKEIVELEEELKKLNSRRTELVATINKLEPINEAYYKRERRIDLIEKIISGITIFLFVMIFPLVFWIIIKRNAKYEQMLEDGEITQEEYDRRVNCHSGGSHIDTSSRTNPATGASCGFSPYGSRPSSWDSSYDHARDYRERHRWD